MAKILNSTICSIDQTEDYADTQKSVKLLYLICIPEGSRHPYTSVNKSVTIKDIPNAVYWAFFFFIVF